MISIDTAALVDATGGMFDGTWAVLTSPHLPLSTWFGASWWMLLNVKQNPSTDWVARLKFTASAGVLVAAVIVDLIRWAQA